jgi:hypothetical protein
MDWVAHFNLILRYTGFDLNLHVEMAEHANIQRHAKDLTLIP